MTTDPRDAEIARLRAANRDLHRRAQKAEGLLDRTRYILEGIMGKLKRPADHPIWQDLNAALDAARAGSGRAFVLQHMFMRKKIEDAEAERDAALAQVAELRAVVEFYERLTGTIGTVALSRRDAQMRAEGRKEGLREAAEIADAKDPDKPTNYLHRRENIPAAILAAAEKEAPHG